MNPRLSKTTVENEKPGDKDRFVWDSELKGFGLKIFTSGQKSFVFQYRTRQGISRRLTIGKLSPSLTAEQARKIAKDHAFEVHAGRDPQGEKLADRKALTVNELLDLYVASSKFSENAEKTRATDRGRIDRHLRPLLGTQIAQTLTEDDLKAAHRDIVAGKTAGRVKTKARGLAKVTGGTGTADKSILLMSTMFNWAISKKYVESNPAAAMKFAPSNVRDTVLGGAEDYQKLFEALQTLQDKKQIRAAAADAVRFIALTGARRGEVVGLRWAWVNLDAGSITLPPTAHKAGRKTRKPRIISLPAEAAAIVAAQPKGDPDSYVFKPAKGEGSISLGKVWQMVRAEAKLPAALGLHGLRHSIGTSLAVAGASPVELMETLGHRQIGTTLRYIHFAEQARSKLAERAAATALAGLAKAKAQGTEGEVQS
jgi:integrase